MKSMAGTAWGSHPDNMLILYKGLVRSVLEYGFVCFAEMAVTHFRVQWLALRISLGLMQSTHTSTVEVLSGVPPLDFRFSYLNHRFLISAFSKSSDILRGRLQTLVDLGSKKMTR
jgi:ribonuclease HI